MYKNRQAEKENQPRRVSTSPVSLRISGGCGRNRHREIVTASLRLRNQNTLCACHSLYFPAPLSCFSGSLMRPALLEAGSSIPSPLWDLIFFYFQALREMIKNTVSNSKLPYREALSGWPLGLFLAADPEAYQFSCCDQRGHLSPTHLSLRTPEPGAPEPLLLLQCDQMKKASACLPSCRDQGQEGPTLCKRSCALENP